MRGDPPDLHDDEPVKRCGHCSYFCNDPAVIESVFKGLSSMSSGSASVRAHDGLCDLHEVYLSYRDTCPDFRARQVTDRSNV